MKEVKSSKLGGEKSIHRSKLFTMSQTLGSRTKLRKVKFGTRAWVLFYGDCAVDHNGNGLEKRVDAVPDHSRQFPHSSTAMTSQGAGQRIYSNHSSFCRPDLKLVIFLRAWRKTRQGSAPVVHYSGHRIQSASGVLDRLHQLGTHSSIAAPVSADPSKICRD